MTRVKHKIKLWNSSVSLSQSAREIGVQVAIKSYKIFKSRTGQDSFFLFFNNKNDQESMDDVWDVKDEKGAYDIAQLEVNN